VSHRTTLTLDDDVVTHLRAEAARTGKPFKTVVNDALRAGLDRRSGRRSPAFKVTPHDLGARPELDLDDIEGLLEQVEGPDRR
jgi:plasmid stability protein